jgi:hypothetical protein
VEGTYDYFMLESTTSGRPDPWKAGRDSVWIFSVGGEAATTVGTLSLGDAHIPENQEMMLQDYIRILARQDRAALNDEILPPQVDTRRSNQCRGTQEITDLSR